MMIVRTLDKIDNCINILTVCALIDLHARTEIKGTKSTTFTSFNDCNALIGIASCAAMGHVPIDFQQ